MATPSEILRAMADRIDRNDREEFAGCVIVIPPEGRDRGVEAGPTVEILLIDPAQDLGHFWSMAKNQTRIASENWETINQQHQTGYR